MKDDIDFANEPLGKLFAKIFIPTLLGMVFGAALNIADGIFVGKGVGSDALAAINIVAPMYLLSSGLGLMFGVGASVVAAIHLSNNKIRTANINISQSVYVSFLFMALLSVLVFIFALPVVRLFGSSPQLDSYAITYLRWFVLVCPFMVFESIGLFVIRLDGAPRYAMVCSAASAVINIILDYIFIFHCNMGIKGAALATVIGVLIGFLLMLYYLLFLSHSVKLLKIKLSRNSLILTCRNVGYMVKLGASAFIGELAIAFMMFLGNHIFLRYLKEDGVAAFSVLCYCFPVLFMINSAVAQSVQPIISFNHGAGNYQRVKKVLRLSLNMAVVGGIIMSLFILFGRRILIACFLTTGTNAFEIADDGMAYFSAGLLFFAVNIVMVGYYQSVEEAKKALLFTLLRGFVFLLPAFLLLPEFIGVPGIWLAVPVSEMLTTVVCVFFHFSRCQTGKITTP